MTGGVLIVEDEFLIAEVLSDMVADMDLALCGVADTAQAAVEMATDQLPELVLMDVRLKGQADGVDAAIAINGLVGSKVIFITGSREPETVARIGLDHAAALLFKPVSFEQLRQAVDAVIGRA